MYHRLIALVALILGAIGIVAPAHADGWSAWKTFDSHMDVKVEWRTYSRPNNDTIGAEWPDTMADWRVTNNSDLSLYNVRLGWRDYTCSSGSGAYAVGGEMMGYAVEFKPGDSYTIGQDGAANWIGADGFSREACSGIVEAHFESRAAILTFALGGPNEQVKPWTEHTFDESQSAVDGEFGCWDARGCVTGDAEYLRNGLIFVTTHKNTCDKRIIVFTCHKLNLERGYLNEKRMESLAGSNCAAFALLPGDSWVLSTASALEPTGKYEWEYTGSRLSKDDMRCAAEYGMLEKPDW